MAVAGELLGRHERGRPEQVPRGGQAAGELRVPKPGEPEVEHDGLVAGRDHDVRRLHVAVDEPGLVSDVKRSRALFDDPDVAHRGVAVGGRRSRRRGAIRGFLRERAPLDVAHREVLEAVRRSDVVDGDDAGMVEPRQRLRLELEALHHRPGGRPRGLQDLQRDAAAEVRVERREDGALRAAPELALDPVAAEPLLAWRGSGRRRRVRGGGVPCRQILEAPPFAGDGVLAARIEAEIVRFALEAAMIPVGDVADDELVARAVATVLIGHGR